METVNRRALKEEVCQFLRSQGHICVPSEQDKDYLTADCTKQVPTQLLVECLVQLNVPFRRCTNFGQKEKTDKFVTFERAIAACTAERSGYLHNYWDISFSKKVPYICVIAVENRYLLPANLKLDRYLLFTPLDDRPAPRFNHGGSTTINFTNTEGLTSVKVYNLLFHLLRACHQYDFSRVPMLKRGGNQRLRNYGEILVRPIENKHSAGRKRFETRILAKTFARAVDQFHRLELYKIVERIKPATLIVRRLYVDAYLDKVGQKLRLAEKVPKSGVTRHHGGKRLNNPQKQILGDLKSLFGYSTHTSYKTDPISPTAWWRTEPRRGRTLVAPVTSDISYEEEEEEQRAIAGVQARNGSMRRVRELMELCEWWRRNGGQRRIMWDKV